ncbi:hypothetical protein LXD69_15145 [Flavobacterium sediminilitoris]|uniref:Bacteriocin-like protein n=1 Tax=Flavobacterium sediminilitoris TaxID=2024526 RepID=A0ABY4HLD4_9FLAO|nr:MULTISPECIES: hypothetical protein [Flavobacterium]UOX33365.1 hypothetical protein LXD69_15145 [Flavobacterium sediminilitoris]
MKKSILSLKGTQTLSRNEQKTVNGGGNSCDCSTYMGPPMAPTCEYYFNLPPQHRCCVMVSDTCFPQ